MSEERDPQRGRSITFNRYWFCRLGGVFCLLLAALTFASPWLTGEADMGLWKLGAVLIVVALVLLYFGWPSEAEKNGYRF